MVSYCSSGSKVLVTWLGISWYSFCVVLLLFGSVPGLRLVLSLLFVLAWSCCLPCAMDSDVEVGLAVKPLVGEFSGSWSLGLAKGLSCLWFIFWGCLCVASCLWSCFVGSGLLTTGFSSVSHLLFVCGLSLFCLLSGLLPSALSGLWLLGLLLLLVFFSSACRWAERLVLVWLSVLLS